MSNLHRIEHTATDDLKFIWDDEYEETHESSWTGWFRGVYNDRYDNINGVMRFGSGPTVLEIYLADGGVVGEYVPPEPEDE